MTFLFDENLSPNHARRLATLGYDAAAISKIGLSGASDAQVRATAIETGPVLVTMDADFGNILRYPVAGTPGVIWLRLHPPTEAGIAAAVDRVLEKLGSEDLTGKLAVSWKLTSRPPALLPSSPSIALRAETR